MYKIKNIIVFISFYCLFIIFSGSVYGNSCSYTSKIEKCISENGKGFTVGPKGIDDFLCIVGTPERIAYQIILDENFKKLDKEMDKYIEDLEINKNTYFGIGSKKTYIDGVNDVFDKKEYFEKKYLGLCGDTIITETQSCMKNFSVSTINTKDFFGDRGSTCSNLVSKKLEIFESISFAILMQNKQQVKANEKKLYDQGQRTNYDRLLDLMNINLGYLERIWQKIPSFISNTYK